MKNEAQDIAELTPAAQKLMLNEQARGRVRAYADLMKLNGLSAAMFSLSGVPLLDETTVLMGLINDGLEAEGYEVRSHSCCLIGTVNGNLPVYSISLWIVTKGGVENKKTILLAGRG